MPHYASNKTHNFLLKMPVKLKQITKREKLWNCYSITFKPVFERARSPNNSQVTNKGYAAHRAAHHGCVPPLAIVVRPCCVLSTFPTREEPLHL